MWSGEQEQTDNNDRTENGSVYIFTVNKRTNIWGGMDYFKCLIKKSCVHNT